MNAVIKVLIDFCNLFFEYINYTLIFCIVERRSSSHAEQKIILIDTKVVDELMYF